MLLSSITTTNKRRHKEIRRSQVLVEQIKTLAVDVDLFVLRSRRPTSKGSCERVPFIFDLHQVRAVAVQTRATRRRAPGSVVCECVSFIRAFVWFAARRAVLVVVLLNAREHASSEGETHALRALATTSSSRGGAESRAAIACYCRKFSSPFNSLVVCLCVCVCSATES